MFMGTAGSQTDGLMHVVAEGNDSSCSIVRNGEREREGLEAE